MRPRPAWLDDEAVEPAAVAAYRGCPAPYIIQAATPAASSTPSHHFVSGGRGVHRGDGVCTLPMSAMVSQGLMLQLVPLDVGCRRRRLQPPQELPPASGSPPLSPAGSEAMNNASSFFSCHSQGSQVTSPSSSSSAKSPAVVAAACSRTYRAASAASLPAQCFSPASSYGSVVASGSPKQEKFYSCQGPHVRFDDSLNTVHLISPVVGATRSVERRSGYPSSRPHLLPPPPPPLPPNCLRALPRPPTTTPCARALVARRQVLSA
eukprot:TRINITY_DN40520_c0_g1_i1.p2 TRINITY_DN40520_c0_g1~~TRINITY_DN40520_c0_g1_i1.p2  ORF type:complete len:264 (-),score=39.64 TRINITY_DN40520_c0_g1_i1:333-1124(-)